MTIAPGAAVEGIPVSLTEAGEGRMRVRQIESPRRQHHAPVRGVENRAVLQWVVFGRHRVQALSGPYKKSPEASPDFVIHCPSTAEMGAAPPHLSRGS